MKMQILMARKLCVVVWLSPTHTLFEHTYPHTQSLDNFSNMHTLLYLHIPLTYHIDLHRYTHILSHLLIQNTQWHPSAPHSPKILTTPHTAHNSTCSPTHSQIHYTHTYTLSHRCLLHIHTHSFSLYHTTLHSHTHICCQITSPHTYILMSLIHITYLTHKHLLINISHTRLTSYHTHTHPLSLVKQGLSLLRTKWAV